MRRKNLMKNGEKKKLKKRYKVLIGLVIICGIGSAFSEPDKTTETQKKENVIATTTAKKEKKEEKVKEKLNKNAALWTNYNLYERAVLSGSGKRIGTRAYVELNKDEFRAITSNDLKAFAETQVENSNYNWVSITVIDSDEGIVFSGSNTITAEYGIIDSEGCIEKQKGIWSINEKGRYDYEKLD